MPSNVDTDKAHKLIATKPTRPASERPVFVGTDWFDEIVRISADFIGDHMVAVIIDEEVARQYPDRIEALKDNLPRVRVQLIKGGESAKSMENFVLLQNFLLKHGIHRDDCLISIGGGTICDVAGFTAAIFSRGVRWISIPTTFMSQFDCAVGGKTGINLQNHKNFCGTFYEPHLSFIDTAFLDTLPDRFFRSAISELAKLALIGDANLFEELCDKLKGGTEALKPEIEQIIIKAMSVKIKTIATDPYQQGLRLALLTGHTTAHALEGASKMHLHHGEALAIGLSFEAFIAEKRGLLEHGASKCLVDMLEAAQLPTALPPELHDRTLISHMRREKRNRGRMISVVLPYKPGKALSDWPEPHVLMTPDELWDELVAYRLERG